MRWMAYACLLGALVFGLTACGSRQSSGDGGPGSGTHADGAAPGSEAGGGPTGDGTIGSACTSNADCTEVPGAMCWQNIGNTPAPGGYCALSCYQDPNGGSPPVDCGPHAVCDMSQMSGSTTITFAACLRICTSDADCRTAEGYHCGMMVFGSGYCIPPGF